MARPAATAAASARAERLVTRRRRALLDDLLVAALDRALALEQVDDVAGRVAEICTSTWRGVSTNRSRNTVPSPNAAAASRWARLTRLGSAPPASRTIRMPRPPPP